MSAGAVLFAAYAYPPNALGYCGTGDGETLLEHASVSDGGGRSAPAGESGRELAERARRFDGAWPYLELIAAANLIPDPLDRRVVEAYWIGNQLLEAVRPADLAGLVESRLCRRRGDALDPAVRTAGRAHHSFQVFAVYPWVGMLRAGRVDPSLHVLDRCRIRWGVVETLRGDSAVVRSQPLTWHQGRFGYGPARAETVTRARDGRGFVKGLRPGEWVALHWDWVCGRLTDIERDALSRYSALTLAALNDGRPVVNGCGPGGRGSDPTETPSG